MSETLTTGAAGKEAQPATSEQGAAATQPMLSPEEWAAHVARVKEARGKFAHLFSCAEERMRRKQEEIDLEEEQSRRGVGSTFIR